MHHPYCPSMPVTNDNQVQQTNLILSTLHHFRCRISRAKKGEFRATYYWKSQPPTTSKTTDSMGSITFQMTKHFKTDSIGSITFQITKHFKAKEATRLSRLTWKAWCMRRKRTSLSACLVAQCCHPHWIRHHSLKKTVMWCFRCSIQRSCRWQGASSGHK